MQRGRFSFRPYDDSRKLRPPTPRRPIPTGRSIADVARGITAASCRFCAREDRCEPGCPFEHRLNFKVGSCWILHSKHFVVEAVRRDEDDERYDTIVGYHDWSFLRSYWTRLSLELLVDRPQLISDCLCKGGIGQ